MSIAVKKSGKATASKKSAAEVVKEVCERATNEIIELMSTREFTWSNPIMKSARPQNGFSKSFYSGVNWAYLALQTQFNSSVWMTNNQVKELGLTITDYTRSKEVLYFSMLYKDPITNKKIDAKTLASMSSEQKQALEKFPFLKYSKVYNVDDIAGYNTETITRNEVLDCERILSSWIDCPEIMTDQQGVSSGYNIDKHQIGIAHKFTFVNTAMYYKTLFHELVHASGKVLKRRSMLDYDNQMPYEELVAELGASFLCGYIGLNHEEVKNNSAAYIKHWIKAMRNDEKYFFRAASDAQKAVNEILKNYPHKLEEVLN